MAASWLAVDILSAGLARTLSGKSSVSVILAAWSTASARALRMAMNGGTIQAGYIFDSNTPTWRIMGVGGFGSSQSSTSPDGRPDLVLENFETGQLTIRYMNGINVASDHLVWDVAKSQFFTFAHDKDLEVVGTGDFSGPGGSSPDGKIDLLARHATDGRQWVWALDGPDFLGEFKLVSAGQPIDTWDTDWRVATQDLNDSTWRLTRVSNPMVTAVGVPGSPPRIDLTIREHVPLGPNYTFTIRRREAESGDPFQDVATGITGTTYSDSTVNSGTVYDYQAQAVHPILTPLLNMESTAVVDPAPIHDRGRLLLIVDGTLYSQIGSTHMNKLLDDLAGDGWTVIPKYDAPRHQDPNWTSTNADNVADIKQWIVDRYNESPGNTKAVLIIGHVTIPYSGSMGSASASDGHDDHKGPWTAQFLLFNGGRRDARRKRETTWTHVLCRRTRYCFRWRTVPK